MTKHIVLTKGLPASGKSTWALGQLEQHPERYKRVNRDSLRQMVDGGKWSQGREKQIRDIERLVATYVLEKGYTPIIDDCNLSPSAQHMWADFAGKVKADITWQDFTGVPLDVCIERDRIRPNSVGEKEIRKMHRMYLYTPPEPPIFDITLPIALVFDLDGTTALHHHRNPYDTAKCLDDLPNAPVISVIHSLRDSYGYYYPGSTGIVFIAVSGRQEQYRDLTLQWMKKHDIPCDALFMRPTGDQRPDYVIKREIYDQEILGKYNVHLVLDDRNQTIRVWRDLGLTCFQVADGDF